jgi:hypothetical protein
MFAPLARQAVLDLNVFVFGRVAQHLETRVLGADFLILSPNGLLADRRRAFRIEAHRILRPDIYKPFRVLRQCGLNVCSMEFFDGR